MDKEDQSQSQSDEPRSANDDQPPSTSLINECPQTHNLSHDQKGAPIQIDLIDPFELLSHDQFNQLQDRAMRVLHQLPNSGEIRVRVVHDDQMKHDHLVYCELDSTTDVLTFDLAHSPIESESGFNFDHKVLDTDLTICFDEATRQSNQRAHSVIDELVLYILHGTLHCLGYDDHSEKEFERMHQREDELLQSAGLGELFYSTSSDLSNSEAES